MATLRDLIIKISANSQSFQTEIARASRMGTAYYKTMQNGGRQAASAARETQRALSTVTSQLGTLKATALGVVGSLAGAFATSQLIHYADTWGQLSSRLKLASTSTEDFTTSQKNLFELSQRTGTSLAANTSLYARIAQAMRDAGYASSDMAKVTETVATALKLSGASTAETQSVVSQFSQAMSSGVLRGDEFRAVMENSGRLARLLAEGLGVSIGGLRDMAYAGQLTTDKMVPLLTQVGSLRKELSQLPATVSMSAQKLENAFLTWVGGADDASGATRTLSSALTGIADHIDTVAKASGVLVAVGIARYFGGIVTSATHATGSLMAASREEIALAQAQVRGTQIATARARAAVYRAQQALVAAKNTEVQTQSEKRLSAAQATLNRNIAARTTAQAALNKVTAVGSRLLGATLGLLGGVPGLVLLGAGAWYTLYQNQEQARKSALAYAANLQQVREQMPGLSLPEVAGHQEKTIAALKEQNKLMDEQQRKVKALEHTIALLERARHNPLYRNLPGGDMAAEIQRKMEQLAVEQTRFDALHTEATKVQSVLGALEYRRVTLIRQRAAQDNAAYQSVLLMKGLYGEINRLLEAGNALLLTRADVAVPMRFPQAELSDKQAGMLEKSRRELELSTLSGEAKARTRLGYEADAQGLTDAPHYQSARQEYIDNGLAIERNQQALILNKELEKSNTLYNRLLASQREQLALGGATTELAKVNHQVTEGELAALTGQQKQILLQNAALLDQTKLKGNLLDYEASLKASNATAHAAQQAELQGYGNGERLRGQMSTLFAIEQEFQQKKDELLKQYQGGDISPEFYQAALVLNSSYLTQRLEQQHAFYAQLDEQQNHWYQGVQEGLANWVDSASDYATQAADAMDKAMNGLVGNITHMLNGNTASWREWATNVLTLIQQILVNAMVVNSLKSLSGSSGIMGTLGNFIAGALPNAKGGVYDSPGLSQYRNQVIDTPTYFTFAKGAGLMGEAGPEAILPLTRGSDGSLGVRSRDGKGGKGLVYSPTYHIEINHAGQGGEISSAAMQLLAGMIDSRVKSTMQNMMRDGGMLQRA